MLHDWMELHIFLEVEPVVPVSVEGLPSTPPLNDDVSTFYS